MITQNILDIIADKKNKQRDVAAKYQKAFNNIPDTNWRKINSAIIERWSRSGLARVKQMAWKIHNLEKAARRSEERIT